jgi:hypothetical protein
MKPLKKKEKREKTTGKTTKKERQNKKGEFSTNGRIERCMTSNLVHNDETVKCVDTRIWP